MRELRIRGLHRSRSNVGDAEGVAAEAAATLAAEAAIAAVPSYACSLCCTSTRTKCASRTRLPSVLPGPACATTASIARRKAHKCTQLDLRVHAGERDARAASIATVATAPSAAAAAAATAAGTKAIDTYPIAKDRQPAFCATSSSATLPRGAITSIGTFYAFIAFCRE